MIRLGMFASLLCLSAGASTAESLEAVGLSIAQVAEPVGLDDATPTLRWAMLSGGKGVRQGACSVRIASRPDRLKKADVWESGQVKSGQPEMTIPESLRLLSGARYFWQVKVWAEHGAAGEWSEVAEFSMGLGENDWNAGWMTPPAVQGEGDQPTWWMRRTVQLDAVPDRVTLSIVSLGYYELYVNGKRVGDEPLAPSVTKLDTRGLCVTHEIGDLLRPGENVIALACSSGWYVSRRFKVHQKNSPLIRLQATAREGKKLQTLFGSDAEWKGREANRSITGIWGWNNFGGEAVDGRLESLQWKELECPAEGWRPVRVVSAPPIEVSARTCPPNRFGATYKAEKVSMSTPCIRRVTITMRA